MSLTAAERETVITFNDADEAAHIATHQRAVITKLKRNEQARLIASGAFEGTPFAEFEIPKGMITFRTRRRTRETMTHEQKARAREVLAANRIKSLDLPTSADSRTLALPIHVSGPS